MVPLTFAKIVGMHTGSQWIMVVYTPPGTGQYRPSHRTASLHSPHDSNNSSITVDSDTLGRAMIVVRLLNQTLHSRWHPKYSFT